MDQDSEKFISPEEMATRYFNRLHFRALAPTLQFLRDAEEGSKTADYWGAVVREVRARIREINVKRRPRLSPGSKGEFDVSI